MADFTRELFLQALDEWGRYPGTFRDLPARQQTEFLKDQGYASVRDLLTHVAAWWEEGRGIVTDTIKNGDKGGRQYDLDAFNAASLKRYQGMSDAAFIAWYESERRLMLDMVSNLTVGQLGVRRVGNWLDAVLLEHLKEHGFDAPRFLVVDMLQREWGDYRLGFAGLPPEKQTEFLQKQGFARFRDVLAHIIAWWEQGIAVIQADSAEDPCDVEDVNAFNAEAVARFGTLEEPQVLSQFDETRLMLASLVDMLPDEVVMRPNVQTWLRADVLDHYHEHAV
jgi:hypothetical protein